MNLLTVGSVAFDSIKTPFGKVDKALGGSATYFSLAASFFANPAIVAVVGNDFKSADEKILKDAGVNTNGLQKAKGKTFAWGGEYSFDLNSRKTLFTHLNVFENFKPQLSSAQKKSSYVFLGNIHPSLQIEVLQQIEKPKFVGLDTMNYWREKTPGDLKKVLRLVNILIINDTEARELSREHNLVKAAKKIGAMMEKNSTIVIKRGEYGLLMFQFLSLRGGQRPTKQSQKKIASLPSVARNDIKVFHLPGYPLEDVVDPTGAGDSFAGGFFGYLAKTDNISWPNLKKACVAGSVMASFCVEAIGTKRLQKISDNEIKQRFKDFKSLTKI